MASSDSTHLTRFYHKGQCWDQLFLVFFSRYAEDPGKIVEAYRVGPQCLLMTLDCMTAFNPTKQQLM